MLQKKEILIEKKMKETKMQAKTIPSSSKVERQDAVRSAEDKNHKDEDVRINNNDK